MTKITKATVKSFIKKNQGKLFINVKSEFDGCMEVKGGFKPVEVDSENIRRSFGVVNATFVGSSRNYFYPYNDGVYSGIEVSNCCGRFILAVVI